MEKFKVLLVYPNLQFATLIPTSLGILAGCLKSAGFEVKVFDTTRHRTKEKSSDDARVEYGHFRAYEAKYKETNVFDDFKKLVNEYKPNLIGVSCVDGTYELGMRLVSGMEKRGIHIIFGGIFPTFSPEVVIENEHVDSVCVGEGEGAIVELCEKLQANESIESIENLWTKKADGTICKNKLRKAVDLDTLPNEYFGAFDDGHFVRPMQGKLKRMLPVTIDRGCPFICTFCVEHALKKLYKDESVGNNFRTKSWPVIKENMLHLVDKYRPDYIYFNSETFLASPEKDIIRLADFYKKNIDLPFCALTNIATVTDVRIQILKEMGCDRLSLGIEHGNEEFRRKILKKTFTNDQIYKAFDIIKKHRMASTTFNIVGFPDETRALALDTIKVNRDIIYASDIDITTSISQFQPYTGTHLRQVCLDKKYIEPGLKGEALISDSVLNMPNFSAQEIKGITRTFAMYVKMPKSFWPDIERAEKFDNEGNRIFNELREIYLNDFFKVYAKG